MQAAELGYKNHVTGKKNSGTSQEKFPRRLHLADETWDFSLLLNNNHYMKDCQLHRLYAFVFYRRTNRK